MTPYLRQLLLLAAFTAFGFIIYVLLFWLGAGSGIAILFYRGVALAILVSLIVGAVATWLARKLDDKSLPIAAAALTFSFNICFLVLLPVTVDRSVTVYLLSTIERQQQAGTDASALQRSFIDDYVVNMGAINRRIVEQQASGNISVSRSGKIRLTAQGQRFMDLSRVVARLFGTDPRFVGAPIQMAPRTKGEHPQHQIAGVSHF